MRRWRRCNPDGPRNRNYISEIEKVLAARERGLAPGKMIDTLLVTVALSMLTTPLLMVPSNRFITPRLDRSTAPPMDAIVGQGHPVVIAGFGHIGEILGRLLHTNGIGATVLEHDPNHVETLRRFHFKVFYGDADRSTS